MILSLKTKATKGVLWNTVDKFAVQGGQFVIGLLLARILMPEDFGLIGMLSIFIAISQTFIDSGMGSGLIQKGNRTNLDFSTVFVFNLFVSIIFYGLLFITAPLIASFYALPKLVVLTRILSLNIVINSLAIVQRTKLTIDIDFKTIAIINVISVIVGGIIGVFFAYKDWGVWALVFQNLIRASVSTLLFWLLSNWVPSLCFSKESFNKLFSYGSKLLVSGLYARGLNEIYNISIGKIYSATDLGYYTTSKQFAEVTAGTVTSILQQVTFPILASLQEDKERLITVYSRLIKMTSFFIFPIMTLLALLADPFIRLFLTEKWIPAIKLLQWLCFARVFTPISAVNMNILNAVGRSDLYLKVDLSKAPIVLGTLLITIPLGVEAIVIGNVITSCISFFINAYMPGKMFGYGAFSQLRDMIPIFIATGIMALVIFIATTLLENLLLKLVIGILLAIIVYYLVCRILRVKEIDEIKLLFSQIIR
jgi:O-antigen/teichoic acid export membrane protein